MDVSPTTPVLDTPSAAILRALFALQRAGVDYSLRRGSGALSTPELDIGFARDDRQRADRALAAAGFHRFAAPGHPRHRFYLAFHDGEVLKIDAKLERKRGGREVKNGAAVQQALLAVRRWRPLSPRRAGPVIAVLGPDGAGKSTLIENVRARVPIAVRSVYLGVRPRHGSGARHESSVSAQRPSVVRELAFLIRNYLRGLKALGSAYAAAWRGDVALCDRHPIEVLAVLPSRRPVAMRLERFLAQRLTPWPDEVVVLDAPAAVMFQRKGEHSPELLEQWRVRYISYFAGDGVTVVSTEDPPETAVSNMIFVVWRALSARRRWPATQSSAG